MNHLPVTLPATGQEALGLKGGAGDTPTAPSTSYLAAHLQRKSGLRGPQAAVLCQLVLPSVLSG